MGRSIETGEIETGEIETGWSIEQAAQLYGVSTWGREFLHVSEGGRLILRPLGPDGPWVDLTTLASDLERRGIELPLLLRFSDLIDARIRLLVDAFRAAISAYEYSARFRPVYPIKVNHQRLVVEDIVRLGAPFHLGLEAGSKSELLVVLAMLSDPDALIICNGYKDSEYIETALMAQKLGHRVVTVIEKPSELSLAIAIARRTGLRPLLGIRARLSSASAGRWGGSSGDRAKFGLSIEDIADAVDELQAADMLDCLQLLHFHIGSQIPAIRALKDALQEASRVFVELHRLGAPLAYFDVGGGLGVDYDGARSGRDGSVNYTVHEYALDVVAAIEEACEAADVPRPDIVTESGRALVAHHAVLVVGVVGVSQHGARRSDWRPVEDDAQVFWDLWEAAQDIAEATYRSAWHDAVAAREQARLMFNLGMLDLRARARAERLFWQIARDVAELVRGLDQVPDELASLPRLLADTYFCNFSVFQSVPDAWAIGQLFPVVPLQRLDERPTRPAVLADLTCDSDGKIDRFTDSGDVLPLHELDGRPYRLGLFMVGAYQEALGDLHNLFGDTHTARIRLTGPGRYHLDAVVEGDTVTEVLSYVEYHRRDLVEKVRTACERALENGVMTLDESKRMLEIFRLGLEGYTYLE